MKTVILAVFLAATPAGVLAQDAPATSTSDEIVVTGVRESTVDLDRLLKAQAVFRANRVTFAPASSLLFQLRPKEGLVVAGMTLTLRKGERSIPVPIDAQSSFVLPDIPLDDWELVHNRGKNRITIRAVVLSPGTSEANRLLGDLRLQCRVGWELTKANTSIFGRSVFAAMGGCSSSRFAIYNVVLQPIAAAHVRHGTVTHDLPVRSDHMSYRAPLADKGLPNTAQVQLRYQ